MIIYFDFEIHNIFCIDFFLYIFSLEQCDRDINVDIVSFMTGLLLGADPQVSSWISFYIRNGFFSAHSGYKKKSNIKLEDRGKVKGQS